MSTNDSKLLYKSASSQVFLEESNGQIRVVKLLNAEHPSAKDKSKFINEFELTKSLDIKGLRKTLDSTTKNNRTALVLEYVEGDTLKETLLNKSISFDEKLTICIELASILSEIHSAGIIHKDLNPNNIIIDKNGSPVVIDFGNSTRLNLKTFELKNPKNLEGTLSYISPEQTGRMNRILDFRSDLYSFGIIMYELFGGQLPFESKDPLEMIYAHIAKKATVLNELNSAIPKAISNIVQRLMSKNAEDRYQSAAGLHFDLALCLNQLQDGGAISDFELQKNDSSGRLLFPDKLYGRESELDELMNVYDRASTGPTELFLVGGYSGIGKSAIINELHRPITGSKGRFISGKFNQLQRSIPHYAFISAVEKLVDTLLTLDPNELADVKDAILDALGNNVGVMTAVVPNLELIVGAQDEPIQIDPIASMNRFNDTFERFIYCIATKENPLVIFIDDLQWADPASLDLLSVLATSMNGKHLLILGAYRDNEIDDEHPFVKTRDKLKSINVPVGEIILDNLSENSINELVSDVLSCGPWYSSELTSLIYSKTNGNCIYTLELLKSLYAEDSLSFNHTENKWTWDKEKIELISVSENVKDLLAGRAKLYDNDARKILKTAAIIGDTFDLRRIADVHDIEYSEVLSNLWKAMEDGWVIPLDSGYKLVGITDENGPSPRFKFSHDRIQEVAADSYEEADREMLHLSIARSLKEDQSIEFDDKVFDMANHYTNSLELLSDSEQSTVREIIMKAALKAQSSAAFIQAHSYAETLIQLLPEDRWTDNYDESINSYRLAAVTNYVIGSFERSQELINEGIENSTSVRDKVECMGHLIFQYLYSNQFEESIQAGREALALLGIEFGKDNLQPVLGQLGQEIQVMLEGKDPYSILEAEKMTDPDKILAMRILGYLGAPTYVAGRIEEWSQTVLISVKLSLEYGNDLVSPYAFVQYGMILGVYGMHLPGFVFGDMACKLSELGGRESIDQKMKTYFIHSEYVQPWVMPFKDSEKPAEIALRLGKEGGNNLYKGYALMHRVFGRFYQGVELDVLSKYVESCYSIVTKDNLEQAKTSIGGIKQYCDYYSMTDVHSLDMVESEIVPQAIAANYFFQPLQHYVFKSQLKVIENDFAGALEAHQEAVKFFAVGKCIFAIETPFQFYGALALIKNAQLTDNPEERDSLLAQFEEYMNVINMWTGASAANFKNKQSILLAEKAVIEGNHTDAIAHFKDAINESADNNWLIEQAISNELIANFYLDQNDEFVAMSYFKEAHYLYGLWGAKSKLMQMEERFPALTSNSTLKPSSNVSMSTSSTTTSQTELSGAGSLDLQSVMKASEVISSEIHFDKLVDNLISVAIENAGANRGIFIRHLNGKNSIFGMSGYTPLPEIPLDVKGSELVPHSIINYVSQKKEVVVVDEAKVDSRFSTDQYFEKENVQSVMSIPIISHGQLLGILYLENSLASAAFDKHRVETLQLLSGQIAISIENSLLYENMERKVQERTEELRLEQAKTEELLINVRDQKNRAERSEAFKQQFLANMSHEIRTPMNAVLGMTSLAIDTDLEEKRQLYLSGIKKSGENLLHIINDILDLSKIEAGKMEIEKIDFSLQSTLEQVKQTLVHKAEEKGLELITQIDSEVNDVVVGDPVRLNQILINLAGNAIKFTPKGSVAIVVSEVNNRIRFSIEDTGVGIPEDKLKAVFESFGQASSSDTRKFGGTGLGLSISQQLVNLMGGNIDVNSVIGSGSKFFFEIEMSGGSIQKLNQRLLEDESIDGSILNGRKILVVDDNEYNRIVASDTLRSKSNVIISEASNGKEAIELLQKESFDVVLMDAQMPIMNGYEATRFIRNEMQSPIKEIQILALTANVLRSELDKCTEAGMNGFIPKPFKAKDLIIGIADVLNIELRYKEENTQKRSQKIMSDRSITDLSYLNEFCEGDKVKVAKYIDIFLKSTPPFLTKLKELMNQEDAEGIANHVHGFNTKLTMMGMKEAKSASIDIENRLRSDDSIGGLKDKIQQLGNDIEKGKHELEEEIKTIV